MGGLQCAKQVIDNGYALRQKMGCMETSILLASQQGIEPTYEEAELYRKKAEELALVCSAIEKRVRGESVGGGDS